MIRFVVLMVPCALFWAASCSNENPVNRFGLSFVASGQVTGAGAPIAGAIVQASADGDSRTDTTDGQGLYSVQLDVLPDSVQLCVTASGFLDTCVNFVLPPETLLVDLQLRGTPIDTVWLTADTVSAGDTAEIVLMLSNPDSAIASLKLHLASASPNIVFDTVLLVSPRFPVSGMTWAVARHDSINTIAILLVDYSGKVSIPPGRGPLMRLRYRVLPAQPPGSFAIDTTSAINTRPVDISYVSGLGVPGVVFLPGRIVVQ